MKERAAMIEMLEQSELYYDAQSSEANTVGMVNVSSCWFFIIATFMLCATRISDCGSLLTFMHISRFVFPMESQVLFCTLDRNLPL